MKKISRHSVLTMMVSILLSGCAYFDTVSNTEHRSSNIESVNLMEGEYSHPLRSSREIILEATKGSVEVFFVNEEDGLYGSQSSGTLTQEDRALVSTLDTAGIEAQEIAPIKSARPGGHPVSSHYGGSFIPRSMDKSVDVFSVD